MAKGIPTGVPTGEEAALQTRRTVKHPLTSPFYLSFSVVPHNKHWADGEIIWVGTAGAEDMYVFLRTNNNDPDGGEFKSTGVAITGTASW